jgi:hypothetical protein
LLIGSGTGVAYGLVLAVLATTGRMWSREEIEWKDRAWRLMENKGQLETDDFTYAGMAAGLAGAAIGPGYAKVGWRGLVGGAGAGSVLGMLAYMGWRYGVKGGKWPEEKAQAVV